MNDNVDEAGCPLLFVSHPRLAWELVARPHLPLLRDRAALARTCKTLYTCMRNLDPSLIFMRSLNAMPNMLEADRIRQIKRSGLLDCICWEWERKPDDVKCNKNLLEQWIQHAVATKSMEVLHWLLGKTLYNQPDWVILVSYVAELLLAVQCGEEAFQLATNAGGRWWNPEHYMAQVYCADVLVNVASCFIGAARYDLFERLTTVEQWPEKDINGSTRYALSLIAAVLTKDPEKFHAWWISETCAKLARLVSAGAPSPPRFLGGIIWMMMRSANGPVAEAAISMMDALAPYIVENPQ